MSYLYDIVYLIGLAVVYTVAVMSLVAATAAGVAVLLTLLTK